MDRIEHLETRMETKGWQPKEIEKTVTILEQAPQKRSDWVRFLDVILYWAIFAVSILANFIVSIVLVPLLLTITDAWLYAAIAVIALTFGSMLEVIIRETEWLQKRHYVIAEVFIPAIALINIYIIVQLSNRLAVILKLPGSNQSPLLIGAIYVLCFSLPHLFWLAVRTMRKPVRKSAATAA
jgi:hypothetical protein